MQANSTSKLNRPHHPPNSPLPPPSDLSSPSLPFVPPSQFLTTDFDRVSLDALPPIHRWTRWGGMAIAASVGLGTLLAAVTPYRVTVNAEATIRPVGELNQIEATLAGTVVEIMVAENQSVQAGEVVVRLDDSQLQTRKHQLQSNIEQSQLQLQQIDAQAQILEQRIQAEQERAQRLVSVARSELRQAERIHHDQHIAATAEVSEIQAQLQADQANLMAAQRQVQRYETLATAGAISQVELEEAQLAMQQQEHAIAVTQAKLQRAGVGINPSDAEIVIAQDRIAQSQSSGDATLAALIQEQGVLMQHRVEIQQQQQQDRYEINQVEQDLSQTIIRAPVAGTLFQLELRNSGQAVAAGDTIAHLAPDDAGLTIKALVSAVEIHQIQVGQPVQLRISACPYPDYGTLSGTVQYISPDVIPAQTTGVSGSGNPTSSSSPSGWFEVTIQPASSVFGQRSQHCSLQLGMTGRADIMTHEETVLTFLLRKVKLLTDV